MIKFNPAYGDRDVGILKPFMGWLKHILKDMSLATTDFNGATNESGSDVKSMLCKDLNLRWEWCFAHIAHAATKSSYGINESASAAANPEMSEFISRMIKTIFLAKVCLSSKIYFQRFVSLRLSVPPRDLLDIFDTFPDHDAFIKTI